jgi:hypothetical protein
MGVTDSVGGVFEIPSWIWRGLYDCAVYKLSSRLNILLHIAHLFCMLLCEERRIRRESKDSQGKSETLCGEWERAAIGRFN